VISATLRKERKRGKEKERGRFIDSSYSSEVFWDD
jgi:hypothetical protein